MTLYVMAISVSVVLTGMAYTLLSTERAERRIQANIEVENQAWWTARSGIEVASAYMEQFSNWRTASAGGTVLTNASIGTSRCTVTIYDDADGNLSDDETEPVRVVSTGTFDGSSYKLQTNYLPRPHSALSYACFGLTSDDMEFRNTAIVRGPVRAHGRIRADSTVNEYDDASFETLSSYTIDSALSPRSYVTTTIPSPSVNLSYYLSLATPITGTSGSTCLIRGYNLTPTANPTGAANAYGIYSLDPGGRNTVLENVHIKGTLIIHNAPSNSVVFQKGLYVEPGPLNYPVLLISNPNSSVSIGPDVTQLVEATSGLVLNIGGINFVVGTGIDYNEDGDVADSFTCMVRGIVWTDSQSLRLENGSWWMIGTLISRSIRVEDSVTVDNDWQLQNSLCPGFIDTGMRMVNTNFKDAP